MPTLLVIQGRDRGKRYDLAAHEGAVGIGRETGNVVQLDDNEVSRRHAEIRRVDGRVEVGDLKSSNGTYVNNRRVDRAELSSGDQIQVGRTVLVYSKDHDDEQVVGQVDIVGGDGRADGSRIVRTMREEDGVAAALLSDDTQNRWLARARSNVQVMYRTALAASRTLEIDDLLGRILQLVFEWVEADRGCIMLLDPETRRLQTKARRDRAAGEASSLAISSTILDYVLERREGVLTSDAQDDDRFASGQSVVRTGVREAICVPMQGRYGTVGVIYVDTTVPLGEALESGRRRFSDEHLKLMIAIGHQAALAVEDTTYYSAMVQSERLAAVGQTIATLSHHIKNILQGIRGGSYLVEMGLENEDLAVVRKGWDIVARNQNKISSLVMDMLSFSKDREPDTVPADLAAVVTDVVETVQQRAADAGVEIRWSPPPGLPRLVFDPEGISRAVLNVVTNALDALEDRPDPRVEIRAEVDEAARVVRVVVSDNGAGMAPETLGGIFELFASTKGSRGTGLGLTVSRKILREHGGDIRAESRAGAGSTFTLEFPLTPASGDGRPDASPTLDGRGP
ncbi:MAG: FHA domain-containing protein [Planctomycetia bacterium]|nr:FHA domain-containing protein [Planctomycetia bacterium]